MCVCVCMFEILKESINKRKRIQKWRMGQDGSQLSIRVGISSPHRHQFKQPSTPRAIFTVTKEAAQASAAPGFSMKIRKDILKRAGRKPHPPPTASSAAGERDAARLPVKLKENGAQPLKLNPPPFLLQV